MPRPQYLTEGKKKAEKVARFTEVVYLCAANIRKQIPIHNPNIMKTKLINLKQKLITAILALLCITLSNNYALADENTQREVIKFMIGETNKQLPSPWDWDGGKDMSLTKISLVSDTAIFNITIQNKQNLNPSIDGVELACSNQILLYSLAMESWHGLKEVKLMLDNDINVRFDYYMSNNRFLCTTRVSVKEYEQAYEAGEKFHCSKTSWNDILRLTQSKLPQPVFGTCSLKTVSADFKKNTLEYVVGLPEIEDIKSVTKQYLQSYLEKNRNALFSELINQMAIIDKMELRFKFIRSDGKEHVTITVPYQ